MTAIGNIGVTRTLDPVAVAAVEGAIREQRIEEVEVLWPDHAGHACGKRIDASDFLTRSAGAGFAFCQAALAWDIAGEVQEGLRLTDWETGYPDMFAIPDLGTFRPLPWRAGAAQVVADLVDHHGHPVSTAPRSVLRRVVERLAALGYTAEVGVEIEFHLLDEQGRPADDGLHAYSLERANALDPALGEILRGLRGFVDLEGGNSEYAPGQVEVNLRHAEPLVAADHAQRFKYATKELARRAGAQATFMAKPFAGASGSSMHVHVSLWRDGEPAFAPDGDGGENELHLRAVAGLLDHLPGTILYGAPTVNSYKRFEALSFAPTRVNWGGDNRTVSIRSLLESPSATRIEVRSGAADAQPHWAVAGVLAAIVAGLEADGDGLPALPRGEGNLYEQGEPLPGTLAESVVAARADEVVTEILGHDAVHDYTRLAELEWEAFTSSISDWDRERYLQRA